MRRRGRLPRAAAVAATAGFLFLAGPARPAGICLSGASPKSGEADYTFLFPNWKLALVSSFDIWLCDPVVCSWSAGEIITGLTIVNNGTANGADLPTLYWRAYCPSPDTGYMTMTYAGLWGGKAVWTWAGTSINITNCASTPDFSFPLRIYADVAPCPANGASVSLGIRVDAVTDPAMPGGLTDQYWADGCIAPWDDVFDIYPKVIRYVAKSRDLDVAAPGDTVNYTITYGRAGPAPLNSIVVTETLPPYTHWTGVASPAPDPGWNPDPGPPMRLRWTFPGPLAVTGGPTGTITFQTTVDWGNGESFEPGSGDAGPPEGSWLQDTAQVSYDPGSCAASTVSNVASVVVRRYLYWMLGDNDVLFAPKVGQPDDEIIYEITIQNESTNKTWWNVSIWDTVPPELDVWASGYGHDDPCTGWTLTPSGCAAANAGKTLAGTKTIMTWRLDLAPSQTLSLRWKARVSPTAPSFSTAINRVSVMALGRTGVVDGTGHAQAPRPFTHVAQIVLRTMYVSYMAWAGDSAGNCDMFITFFPLNKAANFELRTLEYQAAPWLATGGPSASIGTFVGTCLTGLGCAGSAGCKAERGPAFLPTWGSGLCAVNINGNCPSTPFHFIYKLVANAPVLWEMFTQARSDSQDAFAFTPSTSLTFSGLMHYTYMREGNGANTGDTLSLMNTSIDATGLYDPNLTTTAILFTWDAVAMQWVYLKDVEIDRDSQWTQGPVTQEAPAGYYRIVSSAAKLVGRQAINILGGCGTQITNTSANLSPNREYGTLVSKGAGNTFYIFPGNRNGITDAQVIVGNTGPVTATYRIERYMPRDLTNKTPCVTLWLADTTGDWSFILRDSVGPGLPTALNAHIHGSMYDAGAILGFPDETGGMYRLVQETPGNLQVDSGSQIRAAHSGGTMLHAANGDLIGTEFWLFSGFNDFAGSCSSGGVFFAPDFFCPKTGMAVHAESSDGFSARYTTTGPDQCVTFFKITDLGAGQKRNIRVTLSGAGTQGNMVGVLNCCITNHKFFAAPFLVTGTHYDIIAPATVYIGQSFWITVVVLDTGGGTKTDYCGTTSFTSTDPGAKIESAVMDTFNFTWTADLGCNVAPNENGVKIFVNVSMTRLGPQTIVASDTVDGSITGLATLTVVAVDVKLTKEPRLTVAASGDTVKFLLCWSNYSSASAFTFVITDAVPMGTTFIPEGAVAGLGCGSTDGVALGVSYSTATSPAVPAAASFVTANPVAGTQWLRWTVGVIGVQTTGCGCFRVRIN